MIIWAVIGLLMVILNFVSNHVVNTNCRYIYSGSLIVVVGCLVGMSERPVIASSIVFFGCFISIYGSIQIIKRRCQRTLK